MNSSREVCPRKGHEPATGRAPAVGADDILSWMPFVFLSCVVIFWIAVSGGAGMFRCPGSPAARIGCIVLSDGQYRAPSCAAGYPVCSAAGRFRRRRPETVRLYRYLFIDLCYIWGCICYVRWELMAIYCGSRGRIWRMPAEERSCWTTAAPCES